MVERALGAGLEIDRATLDELDAQLARRERDLADLKGWLERIRSSVSPGHSLFCRPTCGARTRCLVRERACFDAVGDGLEIGRRYVGLRDSRAGTTDDGSALAQLAQLLVESRSNMSDVATSMADARQASRCSSRRGSSTFATSATRCPPGSTGTSRHSSCS